MDLNIGYGRNHSKSGFKPHPFRFFVLPDKEISERKGMLMAALTLEHLTAKVLNGGDITREEAIFLYDLPLDEIAETADLIRRKVCGDRFDLCTIINAKSGRCGEDCKFCAQSRHYRGCAAEYPLLSEEEIVAQASRDALGGATRFSIVTSGRRLNLSEITTICRAVTRILDEVGVSVCVSVGLLTADEFQRLRDAGVSRVHNNLETSRRNFPNVCTTHSFEDKIRAIRAAQSDGFSICSGGIMGLGETAEDRIDMALTLRSLGVDSVPVNMLNAIPGTPFEKNPPLVSDDMRRIAAVYRFILPRVSIRLAGGRGLLPDKGKSCFVSGANAAISVDMLTTAGITLETDRKILHELGYKVERS